MNNIGCFTTYIYLYPPYIILFKCKGSTRTFLTDTDILNFSHHEHEHVALKRVRKRKQTRTLPTFGITDTDILHYACQNTNTDTDVSHITCFCTDTDMYLYFMSVIRGHLRHLRLLHIKILASASQKTNSVRHQGFHCRPRPEY